MKIALAQINPTVGDITGNAELIDRAIDRAAQAGAELVVLPELSIVGYPPKDLLLKPSVIDGCERALHRLADRCCQGVAALIGYPRRSDHPTQGRALYNAAALCCEGEIRQSFVKTLLPTYDVFDEHRYFEPGKPGQLIEYRGRRIAVSICEDLWAEPDLFPRQIYHEHPVRDLASAGADLLINLSASPYALDKHDFRLKLMATAAGRYGLPLAYCNQVGGNDELIFDGHSCVFDDQGQLIAHGKGYQEDLLIVDVPKPERPAQDQGESSAEVVSVQACPASADPPARLERPSPPPAIEPAHSQGCASVYHALTLGLRDYCRKCGFKSIVLGLSGGIDSAVCGALTVAALGRENVLGVAMPSRYSSSSSLDDAEALANNLGVDYRVIPIGEVHDAFEKALQPHFAGTEPGTAEENVQARARGVILMALSNKFGSLLVTTGNKSEMAVGYCTLYGDMAGGLAILADVPKTMVWDLARWINDDADSPLRQRFGGPVIPENSISKPPSAELRADQLDSDSLPDYEQLDQIIQRYVEHEQSVARIVEETSFPADLVLKIAKLIDRNEYKRKQAPPVLKVTGRAFGTGRRMPIAQRFDNGRPSGPSRPLRPGPSPGMGESSPV